MKKLTWLVVLVVAVVGGRMAYQKLMDKEFVSSQSDRVTNMFDKLETRETLHEQFAMNLWADSKEVADGSVLTQRYDAFDAWRKEGGFQWINQYRILSAKLEGRGSERRLRVQCDINGKQHTLLASPGQPLRWAS